MRSRLKTPAQPGYTRIEWDRALAAISLPTADDLRLHQSAAFFAEQMEGLRRALEGAPPPSGSLVNRVRRAVGFTNREYLTMREKALERGADSTIRTNELLQREFELADGVNSATPVEFVETIVDGLRFEVAALLSQKAGDMNLSEDAALSRVALRGNLSVFYHVLEEEWLDCLHHGWAAKRGSTGSSLIYPESESHAVEFAVGQYRDQALSLEMATRIAHFLRTDPRAAGRGEILGISVARANKSKRYRVEPMSPALADWARVAYLLTAEPDLAPHLTDSLPSLGSLTISELLHIWTALLPLAETLGSGMPTNSDIHNVRQFEQFAPLVDGPALTRALRQCTSLAEQKCATAIKQMTWRTVRDSLWHRPLVSVPNHKDLIMVLPALMYPNLRRSVEYWLRDGGIDLSSRGTQYEQHVRDEVDKAIKGNSMLDSRAGVVPWRVTPLEEAVGDIDLIFWIGDTVVVGEVKCLLRPATSYEHFQYDDRISEAVEQAIRKADYVRRNPAWLQGVSGKHYQSNDHGIAVFPCVVINSSVGALRVISDVPVIDLYVLRQYLAKGSGSTWVGPNNAGGLRIPFYSDSNEAAERISGFLKEPAHLRIYQQSVRFDTRFQPDFARGQGWVTYLFPVVRVPTPPLAGQQMDFSRGFAPTTDTTEGKRDSSASTSRDDTGTSPTPGK